MLFSISVQGLLKLIDFIRNCKSMKDYGASLTWPEPPRALKETARKFESMFSRWRGYMVIRRVPPEDRDMLKRKLLAWELVGAGAGNGGRQNWGMNRRWYGDYLSQERMPAEYLATIQDIRTKDGVNNIVTHMQLSIYKKSIASKPLPLQNILEHICYRYSCQI